MATRSRIAIENQDGTVKSIYCHWDGYVSHNGRILFNHYDTEKLENLIELGDISALGESTKDTIAYARDRNEDLNFKEFSNVENLFEDGFNSGEEFIYCLTKDGIWLVNEVGSSNVEILKEVI